MKMNDIKFAPKSNAFADVYGKATGVPFIGEMMAAAAGNGGESPEPEPEPEQFKLTVKVIKINDYPTYDMEVHSNIPAPAPVENAYIYIYDDPTLGGCEDYHMSAFRGHFIPLSAGSTEWISEDYDCNGGEIEDGCGYTFVAQTGWLENDISGTWTFEDQTI